MTKKEEALKAYEEVQASALKAYEEACKEEE